MHKWLESTIVPGPWHDWLVDAAHAGLAVLTAAVVYTLLRWLTLRALHAVTRPLVSRAAREGDTSIARVRTLEGLAQSVVTYLFLFLAVVTVLGQLGVNVSAILAGAGVVGLALSFGAQRLVRDMLTGIFLLLEDQFRVGEVVTIIGSPGLPQLNGTILEMGLRITRLQDVAGKLITLGNGDIAAVVNHNRGELTATVEMGVAADTSLKRVREVVATLQLPEALFAGPPTVAGVTELEGDRLRVRVSAPSLPGHAPEAEMALREALWDALREAGIMIR